MVSCVVWWAHPRAPSAAALALLDLVERERLATFRRPADRARFATGRLLVRGAVARQTATSPASVPLTATCPRCGRAHGKVRTPGLELSIAHSGDRVAVAVARGAPVGIDVERGDGIGAGDGSALWPQVLRPTERDRIAALPPTRRREALVAVWTRKEALLKASGDGLALAPMTELEVTPADAPPRLLRSAGSLPPPADVTLRELDAGDGYRATLAVLAPAPIEVREHWAEQLLDALG